MYGARAVIMGLLSPLSRVFVTAWKALDKSDCTKFEKLVINIDKPIVAIVNDPGSINFLPFFFCLVFSFLN